jgi:hypothetical protein
LVTNITIFYRYDWLSKTSMTDNQKQVWLTIKNKYDWQSKTGMTDNQKQVHDCQSYLFLIVSHICFWKSVIFVFDCQSYLFLFVLCFVNLAKVGGSHIVKACCSALSEETSIAQIYMCRLDQTTCKWQYPRESRTTSLNNVATANLSQIHETQNKQFYTSKSIYSYIVMHDKYIINLKYLAFTLND